MSEYKWAKGRKRYQYKVRFSSRDLAKKVHELFVEENRDSKFREDFRYSPPITLSLLPWSKTLLIRATKEQKRTLALLLMNTFKNHDLPEDYKISRFLRQPRKDANNRYYYQILKSKRRAKLGKELDKMADDINKFIKEALFNKDLYEEDMNMLGAGAIVDGEGDLWVYATKGQMGIIQDLFEIKKALIKKGNKIDCPED